MVLRRAYTIAWVFGLAFNLVTTIVQAEPSSFRLSFPLACKLNQNCWIVNYFDHDPSTVAQDFACGYRTYDGHAGTDIGIGSIGVMRQGVAVLAVAGGTVKRIRNNVSDISIREGCLAGIQGKACGNGVFIDHGNGWATQYCHMKQGSITVKEGQSVQSGQKLGFVGLSGQTEFPHLHFQLYHNQQTIDPFTSTGALSKCSKTNHPSLWKNPITYKPMVIAHIAVLDKPMGDISILEDIPNSVSLKSTSSLLALWFDVYGIEPEDQLSVQLFAPSGTLISNQTVVIPKRKAWRAFNLIKKKPTSGWDIGTYHAVVSLYRQQGNVTEQKRFAFKIQ